MWAKLMDFYWAKWSKFFSCYDSSAFAWKRSNSGHNRKRLKLVGNQPRFLAISENSINLVKTTWWVKITFFGVTWHSVSPACDRDRDQRDILHAQVHLPLSGTKWADVRFKWQLLPNSPDCSVRHANWRHDDTFPWRYCSSEEDKEIFKEREKVNYFLAPAENIKICQGKILIIMFSTRLQQT